MNDRMTSAKGTFLNIFASEPARLASIREHKKAAWFAVITVCFGAFMGQLDASIVTLAFPSIQDEFHTSLAAVEWVSLAYLIALVTLLVPIGKLSDRHGRKLFYLYGFIVFTAASVACGFASSLTALVVFRLLQAVGAAMLQANSVALVVTSTEKKDRRAALGVQAAAQALGLALGPVLGGFLVASGGWRLIFFINIPVGVIALVAGWFLLPRTREHASREPADYVGLLLLFMSIIATLVMVSGISGLGLPVFVSVGLAVVSLLAIVGLLWWEGRVKVPLIDFKMLRSSGIAHLLAGALLAYMVLFGPLVLFPQVFVADGLGVLKAGLLLSALPAGFGLAAIGAERAFPSHWHDRHRTTIGGLLATFSALLLAVPSPDIVKVVVLGLLGIGLGIFIPANNAGIMASVKSSQAAVTGGMVNIARGLGTAFGVALVTLALSATRSSGTTTSTATAMFLLAVMALIATWTGHHVKNDAMKNERDYAEIEVL